MTRPDDEFPPLDVTSTLNLGSLDETMDGGDADVTTAGRHPESDIFLDDVTVSRRHAEFVREGNGFIVRDVGSLNGTYLDRERIESVGLAGGDEVQIGKYRLVFFSGHPGE